MNNLKEHRHLGVYGLIIEDDKILLIKKANGPYKGKLDLPGGSIEFGEKPEDTLKREIEEETGIMIDKYTLFDANSVINLYLNIKEQHMGIFYKILSYKGDIKKEINLDNNNDDSLGSEFYIINDLKKEQLSKIAILELEKLGYNLKN